MDQETFVTFIGNKLDARGDLAAATLSAKRAFDRGETERVAVYREATGRPVDVDLGGSEESVLSRIAFEFSPPPAPERRGPGRPKLGVVSREVSLLPRHWEWLEQQRGGASAALRRLVDSARKENALADETRLAVEAAHRFMWDIAGDFPGFEEASRALFAHRFEDFEDCIRRWPTDIRAQLSRFLEAARSGQPA